MQKTAIKIGPLDAGRRMTLDEFDQAEGQAGHGYELNQGVVTVVDVTDRRHLDQVDALRQQIAEYRPKHPGQIHRVAGSLECKILLVGLQSERHPDLAIYKTPPSDEENLWATWVPDIVVEVVSPGSAHRDYVEKRDEYLQFGVREYWIFNAERQEMLVLKRSGSGWKEQVICPPEVYRTRRLPNLEIDCGLIFRAANTAGD